MKKPLLSLVVAFGLMLLMTDSAYAQRRVALVVGNSTYQNAPRLDNPANDAAAVAEMFRKAGFDVVTPKTDLGILDFKRAVREFVNTTRDSDIAVIYYAGHGIEVSGVNYMIPVDAKLVSDLDAEDEAVDLDRLVRALEPARRLRLVILDACRDNPFGRKMQRTVATRTVNRGLAKIEPTGTDTLIAYAAKAGSTAEDGADRHSPFTAALLNNLAEPGLDVRIAFGRVRDEVLRKTGNRQEPFVYGSLGGTTISLVPPPPEVRKLEPSTAEIRNDYVMAERVGTLDAWNSFLAVHGSGFYAELAREQRAKLLAATPGAGAPDARTAIAALPSAKPPERAERMTADRIAWEKLQESTDLAALRSFIRRFPSSPLALTAQHRLELLEQAAAQRRQEELERQKAEREATRLRREEERRAKAAEAERLKAERESARRRQEEERRAKAAEAEAEKVQRESALKTEAARAAELKRQEQLCRRDEERLVRLRAQGSRARDELARFQRELGCERIRGEVVALLEQLAAEAAKAPPARESQTNSPELVRTAQKELRRIGCYVGRETGALDASTKRGIEDYRAKVGQPGADIQVTEDFVSELERQGILVGCIASLPKPEPVARERERRKTEPVVERRRAKTKAEDRREASPARPAQPRARAQAAAPPRPAGRATTGSGGMIGIGF
jgi:hypothetical protein